MIAVTSAASTTALTTIEEVKAQLSITSSDEDTYLESAIIRASATICTWLNVAAAVDGSKRIGQETLVETFRLTRFHDELILSRPLPEMPVSIASVVEDGETIAVEEYEYRGAGLLYRLTDEDEPWFWPARKIVVTYTAGWLLPGDDGRTLPQDIEDAAIGLIKATRFNRTRDPLLRSENILEGLYSYSLFAPSDKEGVLPADVAALLEPYRNVTI